MVCYLVDPVIVCAASNMGHHITFSSLYAYQHQGCGTDTQISGSGSTSGHLIFSAPAPAPTSWDFWPGSGSRTIWSKEQRKHDIICINRLDGNTNFRLRLHHPKNFGSGSIHPKLLWPQLHNSDQLAPNFWLFTCTGVCIASFYFACNACIGWKSPILI